LLFDHPNNLGFSKTTLSHVFAPSKVEQTLHQSEGSFGGQVNTSGMLELLLRGRVCFYINWKRFKVNQASGSATT